MSNHCIVCRAVIRGNRRRCAACLALTRCPACGRYCRGKAKTALCDACGRLVEHDGTRDLLPRPSPEKLAALAERAARGLPL